MSGVARPDRRAVARPDEASRRAVARPDPARRAAVAARDAGVDLIHRVNRWMIVGAAALAGLISLIAAHSFHGHTIGASGAVGAPAQSSSGQPQSSGGSGDGGGLQQPSQAPSPGISSSPAPVVSGGS